MEDDELGFLSPSAIKPILIEPQSPDSPHNERTAGHENFSVGESSNTAVPPKLNDSPPTPTLYQMVNFNMNGVVKNIMIPVPQSPPTVQNSGINPNSETLKSTVPLVVPENKTVPSITTSTPLTSILPANSQSSGSNVQTNAAPHIFAQKASSWGRTCQYPKGQSLPTLGQPLQKICLSDAVKEQILRLTAQGQKVAFKLGPENGKTLLFRSANGKLVGQLLEQKIQPKPRVIATLDKAGIPGKVIQLSLNNAITKMQPINIAPSNSSLTLNNVVNKRKTAVKGTGSVSPNKTTLFPKVPKIVVLSSQTKSTMSDKESLLQHPSTTTEQDLTRDMLPNNTESPSQTTDKLCTIDSITTSNGDSCLSTTEQINNVESPSQTFDKLCTIDSIMTLKGNSSFSAEKPSVLQSCLSSQEILKSLLKVNNNPRHCNVPEAFTGTHIKLENGNIISATSSADSSNIIEDVKPKRRQKKKVKKHDDYEWEPLDSELNMFEWNMKDEKPVIRTVHDAFVRPNYGFQESKEVTVKKERIKRPKRNHSQETTSGCKLGCVGCSGHVKRKRKKKSIDIDAKLKSEHPEITECSVLLKKLSPVDLKLSVRQRRPAVAKKSTTKLALSLKKEKSKVSTGGTETAAGTTIASPTDDQEASNTNLSKSKYLMIKTNAGTFLVPTDSSQPPMVLKGDKLETISEEAQSQLRLSIPNQAPNGNDSSTLENQPVENENEGLSKVECKLGTIDEFSETTDSAVEDAGECSQSDYEESKENPISEKQISLLKKLAYHKPANRIQELKEQLKKQQEEMKVARKLLESSKNVLRTIDD